MKSNLPSEYVNELGPDEVEQDSPTALIEIGQWYWVVEDNADEENYKTNGWLGCVVRLGSNFAEIEEPRNTGHGTYTDRILFVEAHIYLRREYDPESVINGKISQYRAEANHCLSEINRITALLGISNQTQITNKAVSNGNDLVALNASTDITEYKNQLIVAKDKVLPDLFKELKEANSQLARWMAAETLPLMAMANGLNEHVDNIKDRIFNVSLYAGLTEEVVKCCDGGPAEFHEKLHIMQRRLYADEECLLDYQHGGMDFNNIEEFDAWLSKPNNRDRLLPFPRTIVAIRVRRESKERDFEGTLLSAFINFQLGQLDKLTFLYIRNGEQIYRLNTDLDFEEMIFPDASELQPGEPMMVRIFADRVKEIIPKSRYDEFAREDNERRIKYEEWAAANQDTKEDHWHSNPFRNSIGNFSPRDWTPFDDSSVYYDDAVATITKKVKYYNRIALITQGLFDRSTVLHPHPPVKTWTASGFAAAIELVYDANMVLTNGPAPDFESYRTRCNLTLNANSVVIGQEDYWERKEADKECERLENDWRLKNYHKPKRFRPRGNEGPGFMARPMHWKPRTREAVFSWNRERQTSNWRTGQQYGDPIRTTISVPEAYLFNVDAYQVGDYLQFFQDVRTRAQYIKWAPMLLTAEAYKIGIGTIVQEPVP